MKNRYLDVIDIRCSILILLESHPNEGAVTAMVDLIIFPIVVFEIYQKEFLLIDIDSKYLAFAFERDSTWRRFM
jgi:hypothetical protein